MTTTSFGLYFFKYAYGNENMFSVFSAVIIISGIKAADVTPSGLLMLKIAMLIFPLLCFAGSYLIYRMKYKIDSKFYKQIPSDLQERGELNKEA